MKRIRTFDTLLLVPTTKDQKRRLFKRAKKLQKEKGINVSGSSLIREEYLNKLEN